MIYNRVVLDTNFYMNYPDELDKFGTIFLNTTIIEEIDHLKESDSDIKSYKARVASRAIESATNIEFKDISIISNGFKDLDMSRNDNKIIQFAKSMLSLYEDCVLITDDLNVVFKCKCVDMPVVKWVDEKVHEEYTGYKEITLNDHELALHYGRPTNKWNLLNNEYLIIKNENDEIVDKQRWTDSRGFLPISSKALKSVYFGDIKPKDVYQMIAIDSLSASDFTIFFGMAGTAKTMLSLGWIMQNIQSNKIGKCVIIFNSVPLKNNQTQGFYPGSRTEKLLQSSLGGILSSKLGDISMVETMINQGKILIVPTCDIRGIEVSEGDCLYVTEAQNTDAYTMRTILQRAKEGCKIIIEGDLEEQQDLKYCSQKDNGMMRAIEVFKGTKYFSCVRLKNTYRSPISEIAQNI